MSKLDLDAMRNTACMVKFGSSMEGNAVRGFGVLLLIVGILALIGAMSMDVSVSTGIGRVNNIGLMADRQNFTVVGGLIAIGGLLMFIFGGRRSANEHAADSLNSRDVRPCPFCAEPIKPAAIKCKHCGADVPSVAPVAIRPEMHGWTLRVECKSPEGVAETNAKFVALGLPPVTPDGKIAICGFFREKEDALIAKRDLASRHSLEGYVYYQMPR